jgi:putative PD-(D/E)XK family protein DUF4420
VIVSDDLRETWSLLAVSPPVAGNMRVREIEGQEGGWPSVLFGLDTRGHRHVLIPVLQGERVHEDKQSKGVQIIRHTLIDNGVMRSFVDLVCLKPHLHELFLVIVSEVLSGLRGDSAHPDHVCQAVLNRWRELLEREQTDLPSLEKLVGLFGELWHLRELVRFNNRAVHCWTGPEGGRHDFSTGNLALEVKASLQRYGYRVEIHGQEQLVLPPDGSLYLAVLKLERVDSGEALPDLVSSIIAEGGDRYELLMRLAQVDITPDVLDWCKDTRFSVQESRVYSVDADFPRITPQSFIGGQLPAGVVRLDYEIDLTGTPPFPLDRDAVAEMYRSIAAKVQA